MKLVLKSGVAPFLAYIVNYETTLLETLYVTPHQQYIAPCFGKEEETLLTKRVQNIYAKK